MTRYHIRNHPVTLYPLYSKPCRPVDSRLWQGSAKPGPDWESHFLGIAGLERMPLTMIPDRGVCCEAGEIYWLTLDVDLSTAILENPDRYPLKSK